MKNLIAFASWAQEEDNILDYSVIKYGKNQWYKISTLLSKKNKKECKKRWENWVSLSIRKTRWTTLEDKTLFFLQNIFPFQWKTVSFFLKRNPTQCFFRFLMLRKISKRVSQKKILNKKRFKNLNYKKSKFFQKNFKKCQLKNTNNDGSRYFDFRKGKWRFIYTVGKKSISKALKRKPEIGSRVFLDDKNHSKFSFFFIKKNSIEIQKKKEGKTILPFLYFLDLKNLNFLSSLSDKIALFNFFRKFLIAKITVNLYYIFSGRTLILSFPIVFIF